MKKDNTSGVNTQSISPSHTATETTDSFGIGKTRGARSAEILAALRAELVTTSEARAMSKSSARIVAGVLLKLSRE